MNKCKIFQCLANSTHTANKQLPCTLLAEGGTTGHGVLPQEVGCTHKAMCVLEVDLVVWGGNSRIWYPDYSVEGSCRHLPRLHGFLAPKRRRCPWGWGHLRVVRFIKK